MCKTEAMAQDTSNIRLRIPNDLLAKVTEIAAKNQRSVSAEILARLADAYQWAAFDPNALAGELDEIDRRLAVLFKHLNLLDLGNDPRLEGTGEKTPSASGGGEDTLERVARIKAGYSDKNTPSSSRRKRD